MKAVMTESFTPQEIEDVIAENKKTVGKLLVLIEKDSRLFLVV